MLYIFLHPFVGNLNHQPPKKTRWIFESHFRKKCICVFFTDRCNPHRTKVEKECPKGNPVAVFNDPGNQFTVHERWDQRLRLVDLVVSVRLEMGEMSSKKGKCHKKTQNVQHISLPPRVQGLATENPTFALSFSVDELSDAWRWIFSLILLSIGGSATANTCTVLHHFGRSKENVKS